MSQVRVTEEGLRRARTLSQQGMGRAGEALTTLLGHPVALEVSSVDVLPFDTVAELMAGATADGTAGLRCQFSGELKGDILLVLPPATVLRLLEVLLGTPATPRRLSEQEESAIQEVGNILASSFLSELGDRLGQRMMHSSPQLRFGKISDLMGSSPQDVTDRAREVLVVQARFVDAGRAIEGRFFVLPELPALQAAVEGLGGAAEGAA